jgi:hypothetical protein
MWEDGFKGYDPQNLIIDRVGLNYDFIKENNLLWIENLMTSSGKDLSSPTHSRHNSEYVQDYIKKYGVRKCEANALLRVPDKARALCENAIVKYLGKDYRERRQATVRNMDEDIDQIVKTNYNNATSNIRINGLTLNEYIEASIKSIDAAMNGPEARP